MVAMENQPVTVICTYRVKAADQDAFRHDLRRHWPTLHAAGLVTDAPARHYLGDDGGLGPCFVEIFEWKDEEASRLAHDLPEVLRVWEGLGRHVEERGPAKPGMEFPHFQPLQP
jgi:hypothetical protein